MTASLDRSHRTGGQKVTSVPVLRKIAGREEERHRKGKGNERKGGRGREGVRTKREVEKRRKEKDKGSGGNKGGVRKGKREEGTGREI